MLSSSLCSLVVFLDEPTSGLDPENRQHIWQVINSLRRPDRLVLLSTHSMEEAETLCTRLCVLARGAVQCIGTSMHLKAKFGRGYTLTINIHVKNEDAQAVNTNVNQRVENKAKNLHIETIEEKKNDAIFRNHESMHDTNKKIYEALDAFIKDELVGRGKEEVRLISFVNHSLRYNIPRDVSVADVFKKLESNKTNLNIKEWGISLTSLEVKG